MKKIYLLTALLAAATTLQAQPRTAKRAAGAVLDKPVVLPATDVTRQGFTANWKPVSGADAYCVFVYTKHTAPQDGTTTIVEEGFNGITSGSVNDPVYAEDKYTVLDEYTSLPNWSVYEGCFAKSMVGGIVYSPYLDLHNNDGKYRVTLDVVSGALNDSVTVTAMTSGQSDQIVGARLNPTGDGTLTFDFTNGGHDTFFKIINQDSYTFFVDNVRVEQELKKGDVFYTQVALNEGVEGAEQTSCAFPKLDFAPGATEVYYDLYAVARVYDDPDDPYNYEQYYSQFSDMQPVELKDASTISANTASEPVITGNRGGISVQTGEPLRLNVWAADGRQLADKVVSSGRTDITLAPGCYIVRAGKTVKKVLAY